MGESKGKEAQAEPGGEEPGGQKQTVLQRLSRPWALAIEIATLVGTVIAVIALFGGSDALSAEESRLVEQLPPKLASHCRSYDPGADAELAALVSASVTCEPIDAGPDSLKFHLFTNRLDRDAFLQALLDQMSAEGIGCGADFSYSSPWVDARGRVRGELQCADFEDLSRLVWSYEDVLILGSAGSAPDRSDELHSWWQRYVRFDGGAPQPSTRRELRALLPAGFGPCHPSTVLLPMALAGVYCTPGDGIASAGAALFPSRQLLRDFIERRADTSGIDNDGCDESPFSYMSYGWGPDYEPTLGHLLCRPLSGSEWFEWTALGPLVYAYASRGDGDHVRLYDQWQQFLAHIEGVQDLSPRDPAF